MHDLRAGGLPWGAFSDVLLRLRVVFLHEQGVCVASASALCVFLPNTLAAGPSVTFTLQGCGRAMRHRAIRCLREGTQVLEPTLAAAAYLAIDVDRAGVAANDGAAAIAWSR